MTYAYDAAGNRTSRTDARGMTVQDLAFDFDPNGNITAITSSLDASRHQAFGYDALDRLIEGRAATAISDTPTMPRATA